MALGCENRQGRFDDAMLLVGDQLPEGSIYRLLAEHGGALFGDDYFADLFKASTRGRPTVPARVVATVMLLQAYEGLSDREACDRLAFDLRWKAAAGLTVGAEAFHPTVLVGMRNRLRKSDRPRRLFDDVNTTAQAAGLLRGRRRVLDSTPLFDAVATQDTVIQLRAAIRKVLSVADRADPALAGAVRQVLTRDDDYASLGKPPCDWDDPKARESLVDALARDAQAALEVLDGRELDGPLAEAAQLLGLVAGQDVEAGEDGVFRIARRVARDRLISTVDVEARHGHKSRARTFDGYKSHLSVDPDEELITNVAITAANTADREVIDELLNEPVAGAPADAESDDDDDDGSDSQNGSGSKGFEVYGDSAYAGGATLDEQTQRGHDMRAKVPPVRNANGYSKDQFRIDLAGRTVTCPADHTVSIRAGVRHPVARFGVLCQSCPLRAECTKSRRGRVISIHPREAALQHAKARQRDPAWQQDYRTYRPVVERKISHFTHRPWGGRRARCRGHKRILTDILARAGAINLARLAALGLHHGAAGWAIA
ncbi:transposase [Mycobacterium riyadhense]|uniref:Transposase n=1 Tax=Mycobacterium riyadhense TaxID=486698 RepID=A0A1X2D1P0_9MYCO|nr:transposase [Mycobacterium riyadhense]MCV7145894.1 transposase [Mycobacterium riyadhense]ORW81864.1 transposase [Mycobacterium riyadhense]